MSGWQGSTRQARLPRNWNTIRARILRRDQRICHVCHRPGADQVDHLKPGDNHTDANLAAIHDNPCHRLKSAREGAAARRQQQAQRLRPQPQHPGATGGG